MSFRRKKLAFWRIALATVGLGMILGCGYRSYNAAVATKTWQPVAGRVAQIMTKPIVSVGKFTNIVEGRVTVIKYRYQVGSVVYESSKLGDGPGALEAPRTAKIEDPVTVYVNQNSPSESVLYPGITASVIVSQIICSLVGLVLLLIALAPDSQLDYSATRGSTEFG